MAVVRRDYAIGPGRAVHRSLPVRESHRIEIWRVFRPDEVSRDASVNRDAEPNLSEAYGNAARADARPVPERREADAIRDSHVPSDAQHGGCSGFADREAPDANIYAADTDACVY